MTAKVEGSYNACVNIGKYSFLICFKYLQVSVLSYTWYPDYFLYPIAFTSILF